MAASPNTANTTTAAPSASCSAGVPVVNCLVDPCSTKQCDSLHKCVASYCGSCSAVCKLKPLGGIMSALLPPLIPVLKPAAAAGNTTVDCPYAPCIATTCPVSAYKTLCIDDMQTCTAKCVEIPPPSCRAGQGFNATTKSCQQCRAGTRSNAKSNSCVPCPVDTMYVAVIGTRSCLPCPKGQTTKGLTGQTACVGA